MEKIKAAVIGLGFIGRQHVEAIRRVPGIEVVAASDADPKNREWCRKNDIPLFYEDYRKLICEAGAEVIHDCTPNYLHYQVNGLALEQGCHVYSEKPLTLCSEEAFRLADMADAADRKAGVNFQYRNHVCIHEIRERIRNGELGRLSHIQAEYLQDWLLYEDDYDWRMESAAGGISRAVGDIGSHCFDAIQFVTAQKIKAVYARYYTMYPVRKMYGRSETFSTEDKTGKYEEKKIDTEDAATILFRLEDGMEGTLVVSQVCAGKKNGMKILISGNKESVEWAQEEPDKLHVGKRDTGNEMIYAARKYFTEYGGKMAILPNGHPVGWTDALAVSVKEFYDSIRNPDADYRYADFRQGAYVSKIVEACFKSSRQNCWIDVG